MESFKPYTYIHCPCSGSRASIISSSSKLPTTTQATSSHPHPSPSSEDGVDDDEQPFDPQSHRAPYSLYPPSHLLYCEDCHQIRCPRCVLDEIVTWYCPNCLFEVPAGTVRAEGNRCTRSCFQCAVCTSPLSVSSIESPPEGLGAEHAAQTGPYVLNCAYCYWSSLEIGMKFEKPNGIFAQLMKGRDGGPEAGLQEKEKERRRGLREQGVEEDERPLTDGAEQKLDPQTHFSYLKSFYAAQLVDSSSSNAIGLGFPGDYAYSSPSHLSRIMGLYTGGGSSSSLFDRKLKAKASPMREALSASEGLQILPSDVDIEALKEIESSGFSSTTTAAQRREQTPLTHYPPQFQLDLRPIPNLLRTKRSKRCKACRHILSKPESKVQNTRFRIRLIALNYIPSITIKPLQQSSTPISATSPDGAGLLTPLKPTQFLLTFKNPLFERIEVSIATPSQTPGRFASKVIILCPLFEVGANTDVWDEVLTEGTGSAGGADGKEKRRTKAEIEGGQQQAGVGKVWEKGRNWTSVVVEVVPASFRVDGLVAWGSKGLGEGGLEKVMVKEGEDVLEIPVLVRVKWEVDVAQDEAAGKDREKDKDREARVLEYWCVLGVGRIASD